MEEIDNFMNKVGVYVFHVNFKEFCEKIYEKDFKKLDKYEKDYYSEKYSQMQKNFVGYYVSLDNNNKKRVIEVIREY
jgi:hypothetical protein